MGTLLRRFLVLAALMFWQGGFTFYAAVVVPVGQEVVGRLDQSFLTRRVTVFLNLSGAVALVPLAWDAAKCRDLSALRRRGRWTAWVGMLVCLGVLFWLHQRLDARMDAEQWRILDRAGLMAEHRWYLWISTFQWDCGVAFAGLTLAGWRSEDQRGMK